MTPAARLQATIESLSDLEESGNPASHIVSRYLRKRRYIGAKDRSTIRNSAFDIIRDQFHLDLQIRNAGAKPTPRSRALANILIGGNSLDEIALLCTGHRYSPPKLTEPERIWLLTLTKISKVTAQARPNWVRGNYPSWLEPELWRSFGGDVMSEMVALDSPAPTDLRVNEAKANRKQVLKTLHSQGFKAEPTSFAANGIRLFDRPAITSSEAYRNGLIELQDEGAQLIANLVDVEPGHCVIDFCAGAGGKTLALAPKIGKRGQLIACDTDSARLNKIKPRLKRAGVRHVETRVLTDDDAWLTKAKGTADRVLLDVPCSGTGAWRRDPDARHRLTPTLLANYVVKQQVILDLACHLVRPGGRLIYATCSVLASENKDQIERFLHMWDNFSVSPVGPIWRKTVGTNGAPDESMLQLTPKRHGVDGFFLAVLTRTR